MVISMPDLEKVFELIHKVRAFPFVIAYSGGKDSSVTLDIVARYADKYGLEAPIYVVYNETWLDPPPVRKWVYSHLEAVKRWAKQTGRDFKIIITTPPPGKDFFTLVLEKGYALPVIRWHAPWCNKEMKTRPTGRLLKKIMQENGYKTLVYVTGGRITESSRRKKSLRKLGVESPLSVTKKEYVGKVYYLAPIYDWKDEEVLTYLKENTPTIFGDSYIPLLNLYRRYGENGRKLRTGCWICPQVKRDKFLEAYAKDHPEYKIVLETRDKIINISENPKYRTAISKNGYPAGRITLEGRRLIAKYLYELIQTDVGQKLMKDYLEAVPSLMNLIYTLINKNKEKTNREK